MQFSQNKSRLAPPIRRQRGSQIAEFGAAIILLTSCILLPALDLSIIPIRWMMAQEIIKGFSRQLAFCESFSESEKLINCPPSLVHRLDAVGGLKVQSVKLCLKIARVFHPEDFVLVAEPRKVPEAWLPEHANAPSTYTLLLEVKLLLSPAMLFSDGAGSLPGVTSPIPIMISASHQWENLGRNPETGMFFLNE